MEDERSFAMLRRDVERLEDRVAVIPRLEAQAEAMGREVGQLRRDMEAGFGRLEKAVEDLAADGKRNRWTLIGFAMTIAGAAISVVFAVVSAGAG